MDKFVRNGHQGVRFFVGPEVEQTPAFGKKTLFVVGLQDTVLVERLAREYKTPHIFLSANRSFDSIEEVNPGQFVVRADLSNGKDWETQIHTLLDKGFMVSLDYPAHKHATVLKMLNAGIWQSRNFVPVLSVIVPNVSTSSVNLTVKIDDVSFKATNPGVWCMNHSEVTDSNRFTDWQDYGDDLILTEDDIAPFTGSAKVVTPVVVVQPSTTNTPERKVFTAKVDDIDVDIVKTAFESVKLPVSDDTAKNDTDAGLDTVPTTALKPEETEVVPVSDAQVTPEEALAAYADGAKVDPLGKEASKKPVKKKV